MADDDPLCVSFPISTSVSPVTQLTCRSHSHFATPDAALSNYRALCSSLQRQLSDANAELVEYHESSKDLQDSSKELQDELEKELERLERQEAEVRKGLEEARSEAEQWKVRTCSFRESNCHGIS